MAEKWVMLGAKKKTWRRKNFWNFFQLFFLSLSSDNACVLAVRRKDVQATAELRRRGKIYEFNYDFWHSSSRILFTFLCLLRLSITIIIITSFSVVSVKSCRATKAAESLIRVILFHLSFFSSKASSDSSLLSKASSQLAVVSMNDRDF